MDSKPPFYDASATSAKQALHPPSYHQGPFNPRPPTDSKRPNKPQAQAIPQAAPPIYSASSNPAPDGRRLLHVYHQGWSHQHTQVMDSDKVTPLYTINANSGGLFSSKPHMTILNASTKAIVGTITFRQMSGDIDLEIHGKAINFAKPSLFTSTHEFRSLATGKVFKWKKDGIFSGGDLKCIDEREQVCANFESSRWAVKKDGKFEIAPMVQGPFMDEVLVTGIAAMEYQRKQGNKSSAGGGGGA